MADYTTTHAKALARLAAKGFRITFTRTVRTPDATTGQLGSPVTTTVSGYALGMAKGDPTTYARLGLTLSGAPSLMVVCDTYGDVPMDLGACTMDSVPHTVRDVAPYAPGGLAIYSVVVIARGGAA